MSQWGEGQPWTAWMLLGTDCTRRNSTGGKCSILLEKMSSFRASMMIMENVFTSKGAELGWDLQTAKAREYARTRKAAWECRCALYITPELRNSYCVVVFSALQKRAQWIHFKLLEHRWVSSMSSLSLTNQGQKRGLDLQYLNCQQWWRRIDPADSDTPVFTMLHHHPWEELLPEPGHHFFTLF